MKSFSLAILILRRLPQYALFNALGLSFLIYVILQFASYQHRLEQARKQLLKIDADVIAPKGSSVDHLRRLFKTEVLDEPALIPSQLYKTLQSDAPKGLKLTPVLFWGTDRGAAVIAANSDLKDVLMADLSALDTLADSEVIVGRGAAKRLGLKVGDLVDAHTAFGRLATSTVLIPLKIKAIEDLGAWDGALLTSLAYVHTVLAQVSFTNQQIWKDQLLSYVFVTGPEDYLKATKQLIDTRTVAVDLRLSDEGPALLKLSGLDEKLERKILSFALLSALLSLVAILSVWVPVVIDLGRRLRRSGLTGRTVIPAFILVAAILLGAGWAVAILLGRFFPLV